MMKLALICLILCSLIPIEGADAAFVLDARLVNRIAVDAANGDRDAQFSLCVLYGKGLNSAKPNYEEARRFCSLAAKQGHAMAESVLASFYEDGLGGSTDARMARALYERAAIQGDIVAETNLGSMLFDGRGGPPDLAKAYKLFLEAARRGESMAMYNVGVMLRDGTGVQKDPIKALAWLSYAASRGNPAAEAAARELQAAIGE